MIPFLNLKALNDSISDELSAAITSAVSSGRYIGGPEVTSFEDEFATYTQSKCCVSMNSGLDALIAALKGLGVGVGDEVIVPAHTFIATWLAVSAVGATPIPVDVDPQTLNIDTTLVEEKIRAKTKAVIAVHLYGFPCELSPLLEITKRRGIFCIEDAAQAHGAQYEGKRIGSHSHVVAWSFYPGKNLGALGDGGAITTNDSKLAEAIRRFCNYGSSEKYVHLTKGVNSRLDPIQASVLRVKLKFLDQWNEQRQAIADQYRTELQGLKFDLPQPTNISDSVWHLYCLRVSDRDRCRQVLLDAGIETMIHYPTPPHLQGAYASLNCRESFPVAEHVADELLSLPMGPMMESGHVSYICDVLRTFSDSLE